MARNVRVEYNKEACIGHGSCVRWSKDFLLCEEENKAELKGARRKGKVQVLQRSCADFDPWIQAAKNCPVNAIRVMDADTNEELVGVDVKVQDVQEVTAEYNDAREFVMDEKGYFLIRINEKKKEIEVGFCPELNKLGVKITGRKPLEIYQTIIKKNLVNRLDHAAYLGRELQKAYDALQAGLSYVQDDELDFKKLPGAKERK